MSMQERERGTCRRWKWRECLEMHIDEREREREREREQFGVWMVRERAQSSPFLSSLYILAALHFNHKLKILKFSKILN